MTDFLLQRFRESENYDYKTLVRDCRDMSMQLTKWSADVESNIAAMIAAITDHDTRIAALEAFMAEANGLVAWTPSLLFGGAAVGMTYSVQRGNYVKIGKVVLFTFEFTLTAIGTSVGSATVVGLPFTPVVTRPASLTFAYMNLVNYPAGSIPMSVATGAVSSQASFTLRYSTPGTNVNLNDTHFVPSSRIIASGFLHLP